MTKYTTQFCPDLMRGFKDEKPRAVDPLEALQAKAAKAEDEGVDGKGI